MEEVLGQTLGTKGLAVFPILFMVQDVSPELPAPATTPHLLLATRSPTMTDSADT